MMKKIVLLMVVMLSAGMSLAGNVKVMSTKYKGADYDLASGPYMIVNVKLFASHVASEEYACYVLVNNEQWDGENMTIPKLSKLIKTMCFGEAKVEAVTASKILEMPMSIVMDKNRLTGRDTVFYMKTVVVDFTQKAIISQSDMIKLNIDAQRASEQMMESVGAVGFGLFGGLMSGGGSGSSSGGKTCPSCGGSGLCKRCNGTGVYYDSKCSQCGGGEGKCNRCGGSGSIAKDLWDHGMDEYKESQRKKDQNKKQQSEDEDSGLGGLFDGLLGF